MFKRFVAIILMCNALTACTAVTKSEKLVSNARPIKSVSIVIALQYLPAKADSARTSQFDLYNNQYKKVLAKRMKEIFEVNGVAVDSITVENNLPRELNVHQFAAKQSSHILALTLKSLTYKTYYSELSLMGANFNAELWDANDEKIVWKSIPYLAILENQPMLRSQHMTGQILNGLNSDGLIQLKQVEAIDLKGERISDYYIGTTDR